MAIKKLLKSEGWLLHDSVEKFMSSKFNAPERRDPFKYPHGYYAVDSLGTGQHHFFKTERDVLEFICGFESSVQAEEDELEFTAIRDKLLKVCVDHDWTVSEKLCTELNSHLDGEILWVGEVRAELAKGPDGWFEWLSDDLEELEPPVSWEELMSDDLNEKDRKFIRKLISNYGH